MKKIQRVAAGLSSACEQEIPGEILHKGILNQGDLDTVETSLSISKSVRQLDWRLSSRGDRDMNPFQG